MLDLFFALLLVSYVAVPVLIVWGWFRYYSAPKKLSTLALASCVGLALATASALVVVGIAAFAHLIGGFEFYDQRLKLPFRIGILFASTSIVPALIGIWRKNPLRWHAPACSLGMTIIWIYLLAAE